MNNPLVSILIITYNSARYVIETLESAKRQTYQNIELIISDDDSKDETVSICKNWLEANNARFVRSEIILAKRNTGIPGNCNRGINAANGKWVKLIAGDDILMEKCIQSNILFSITNNSSFIFSDLISFRNDKIINPSIEQKVYIKNFVSKNQKQKHKSFIRNPFFLNVPTLFIKKKLFSQVEGYDEQFRLLEDQPFILKILKKGYDIGYLNEVTVRYRLHSNSVVGTANINLIKDLYNTYLIYRKPSFDKKNLLDSLFIFYIELDFFLKHRKIRNSLFYRCFNKFSFLLKYFS